MGTVLSRSEEPVGAEGSESPRPEEAVPDDDSPPAAAPADPSPSGVEAAARRLGREEELAELRADLASKRAQRREALDGLRAELTREREERLRLEALLGEDDPRAEVAGLESQVRALKDVAKIGGEMLRIRELQVNELKEKLKAIEETGAAYEKEVESMRKLKNLYEERSRATAISHQMEVEREKTKVLAAETRLEIAEEKNRELTEANTDLQERIASLDSTVDKNNNEISELRIQLAGNKEELYKATSQITIVNNLFSQLLTDPESLDRVSRVMEEHHDLVNHLTEKGNINDVASVLMTVADKGRVLTEEEQGISSNLSKVWRLLVELLGHHSKQAEPAPGSCYKSVDTPDGPKLVISVSQTFLRLKDLILEKNSLVKEVGRLKDLNTHLEERLISQESRLVEVAEELHKTWGVVNKLKTQHKAIHTHEQVLRYEFKHKRLMLNELKQQLEECREMWQMARVKNTQTEKDWNILRKEFADRKHQISSAESGYEESPGDSQDEEDCHKMSDDESDIQEFPTSRRGARCLRINRLQNSEMSTPDRSNTPDIQTSDGQTVAETDDSEMSECCQISESARNTTGGETFSAITEEQEIPEHFALPLIISATPLLETTNEILNESTEVTVTVHPVTEEAGVLCAPNTIEHLSVDIEPTVRILPWNDTPEEEIPELNQAPILDLKNVELSQETILQEIEESVAELPEDEQIVTSPDTVSCCQPKISSNTEIPTADSAASTPPVTTAEEILARREARLRRLEEQCQHLFNKMSNTNKRSDIITSRLVELHEQYGDSRGEPSASQNTELQDAGDQSSEGTPVDIANGVEASNTTTSEVSTSLLEEESSDSPTEVPLEDRPDT